MKNRKRNRNLCNIFSQKLQIRNTNYYFKSTDSGYNSDLIYRDMKIGFLFFYFSKINLPKLNIMFYTGEKYKRIINDMSKEDFHNIIKIIIDIGKKGKFSYISISFRELSNLGDKSLIFEEIGFQHVVSTLEYKL